MKRHNATPRLAHEAGARAARPHACLPCTQIASPVKAMLTTCGPDVEQLCQVRVQVGAGLSLNLRCRVTTLSLTPLRPCSPR